MKKNPIHPLDGGDFLLAGMRSEMSAAPTDTGFLSALSFLAALSVSRNAEDRRYARAQLRKYIEIGRAAGGAA